MKKDKLKSNLVFKHVIPPFEWAFKWNEMCVTLKETRGVKASYLGKG